MRLNEAVSECVRLKEAIPELEEIDAFVTNVCRGLPMMPGSIFRIAAQYLENWGISITHANRDWVEARGQKSYHDEWKEGTGESNDAIEGAIEKSGLIYGNKDLNSVLADTVVQLLTNMSDTIRGRSRTFAIMDAGAGTGDTTIAILDSMLSSVGTAALASKCHFYILEPSFKRLEEVYKRLEEHPLKPGKTFIASNLEEHLRNTRNETYDMVVSNAVFHHMGFPTHLKLLRESLAKDGVMVVGDWYTSVWQHPAYLVPILRDLGASDITVRRFENFFHIRKGDMEEQERRLTKHQREANTQMFSYVSALADELRGVGSKSQLCFLEAHESLDDRLGKLKAAGFETDMAELKRNYRGFINMKNNPRHLYQKSDIACVVSAAKICR
ncbi:class I SAM-dependent methyltransferase [Candidatus Micrarchaeota archaeon]|nr:class I SAM-dependent methyltransferase [Candidatus Micrarchaeota archaeon]